MIIKNTFCTFICFLVLLFGNLTHTNISHNNSCDISKKEQIDLFDLDSSSISNSSNLCNYEYDPNDLVMSDYNQFDACYETDNFLIEYESAYANYTQVMNVGAYYESIRTSFISMGFRLPLCEPNRTKLRVGLLSTVNGSAATFRSGGSGTNVAYSWIIHYNFSTASDFFKEQATHEYFHAVQNAYNYNTSWFAEASANWAKIIVKGTSYSCDSSINSFIGYTNSMFDDSVKYGAVLFPLTIHKKCGGYSAIRKIYEEFNNHGTTFSNLLLKQVINAAIQSTGYNETFDTLIRATYSYLTNTSYWFNGYANYYNWNNMPQTVKSVYNSSYTYSYSGTISPLSSKFIVFNQPSSLKGTFDFSITFNNGDCWTQRYTKNMVGQDTIVYDGHNSINTSIHNIGLAVQKCGLILTNVSLNQSSQFVVKYTFCASGETLFFDESNRIFEKRIYLSAGEVADFNISFEKSGKKIIQTLSSADTKIQLLDASGVILNNGSFWDDAGYDFNSMVAYDVVSNQTYKIKVSFYYPTYSGYLRLIINDAYRVIKPGHTSIESFDDFWNINTSDTYTLYTYVTQFKSQIVLFTPLTSCNHTVELISTFDNYLYIFDPESSQLGIQGVDYDDDSGSGTNAKITRFMQAGKPYLIIFSQYNPAAALVDYDTGDDLQIKITI